jgi:UDP-glucose 4-epimerase
MKVVVTGARGHLGTWVTDRLARAGHQVVALRSVDADISRDESVAVLASEMTDAAVVHLAAWHPPATANTTAADRRKLLDVNVHGTMRVLEAARAARASAVVYASTFEVYGDVSAAQGSSISESTRVTPITDYGATKLAGEDHLVSFGAEEGIRYVALRFPAVYGPGETTSRALPNFLRSVARGEVPTIAGDGADLRDQIHVRDAARAVECALHATVSGIFNAADGEPHSIAELATTAMRVAGLGGAPKTSARVKPRRDYHMSIDAAKRQLGFVPETSLERGMAEQLAWLRAGGSTRPA